jgi:phage regulatory protein, rha family
MENLVQIAEGQVVVSSRQVAEHFEKRHADVLASIENLKAENSVLRNMFCADTYKVEGNNKTYPEYLMNRDGFSLLVMGFTGKKALEWKIKYIQAFNAMEEELRHGGAPYVLIMKRYKNRPVLSTADVAALLGTARESISQTLQEPLAKCKHGQDYYLVQGENLVMLKRDNPSISALASSVLLIAESGLRKVCAFLKLTMPAVFGAAPATMVQPKKEVAILKACAAPASNKEIGAWVKDIRGYMDVLDGLLHKYEQQNLVKTQEALKEVMRSVGQDIFEDVIRLTCQKYDIVTI